MSYRCAIDRRHRNGRCASGIRECLLALAAWSLLAVPIAAGEPAGLAIISDGETVQARMAAVEEGAAMPRLAAAGSCCSSDGCQVGRREFWMVSTRCAPVCHALDAGVERITFRRCEPGRGWISYSLDEFLDAIDPSLTTTIHVHGNLLDEEEAIEAGRRVYANIGRGVPSFRLILWSWPAERIKGMGPLRNLREKSRRSEVQGYYLAWLVGQIDPAVTISLAGHSFGAQAVVAALQGLATGTVAGYKLPEERYRDERRMQAALVAAAIENTALYPGQRYGLALTQVDRMLITKNPQDRTLRVYSILSPSAADALGATGIPDPWRLGDERRKVVELLISPLVGKAHRWSRYSESPEVTASLRPYFFYFPPAE